ncbi:MAG: DUF2817 domain-containing protein [Methylococcaceae bacterium]|jgi:hypothetical protein
MLNPVFYKAPDANLFPINYAMARQQWLSQLEALKSANFHLTFPYSGGQGPDGDALFTDSVWLGPKNAAKVLVLLAGTHGVEGFAGSAVQLDLLQALIKGRAGIAPDIAILLVHALTPWGYAWLRRCDAEGIDLNRNMIDFTAPLPINVGYEELLPVFATLDVKQREQAFMEWEKLNGRASLESAISAGQYIDPTGPFYGGQTPAHGRLVCEDLIQHYTLAQKNLAVIDIHSGLGPYGYGEIICDHQPDSKGAAVAGLWFGDACTLPWLGTSFSVPKLGLLDYAWHNIMNQSSCYVTLEFGTFRTDQLFEVLLHDHQLWAQKGNLKARLEHSEHMRRHFCPDDPFWKELVLFRARQVISQALAGLAAI